MSDVSERIDEYDKCKRFSVIAKNLSGEIISIYVEKGCFAGCGLKPDKETMKWVN